MKNCSKNSHVITTCNRQNSFHAINRLKIQHIDNILKHYFLNLIPMTKSSIISMDVRNWDDFDYFNWIRNNLIALAQKKIFNNVLTNIIHCKSNFHPQLHRQLLGDTLRHLQLQIWKCIADTLGYTTLYFIKIMY